MQNQAENSNEDELLCLKRETLPAIAGAGDSAALEETRVASLGKKGRITESMKMLGALPPEARKERGAALNALKEEIIVALEAKQKQLAGAALEARLAHETIDVTLP